MQRTAVLLAVLVVSTLAPSSAFAQLLCRCAQVSLEGRICQNDLTARIFVWGGYTDGKTGNRVYAATVQETFHGEASGRIISVEVPRDCGLDLRSFISYGVSLNGGVNADYSTFACSSWVKPWREVTRAELATLREPSCAPTCDDIQCDEGESCALVPVVCVRAPCPPLPTCVPDAAAEGEVCYRFSESDPDAFVDRPCEDGLKCTSTSNAIGFNSERFCKPQTYCIDERSAAADCASLPHIAVPGRWGCNANTCVWRVGR